MSDDVTAVAVTPVVLPPETIQRKKRGYHYKSAETRRLRVIRKNQTEIRNRLSIYDQGDEYFKKVEADAIKAGNQRDLQGEIKLLRASTLELLKKFNEGTATAGHGKDGDQLYVSDLQKAKMVCELTKSIGRLAKHDFDMAKTEFISWPSFQIWLAHLVSELKRWFPTAEEQDRWKKIAQVVGEPARGK